MTNQKHFKSQPNPALQYVKEIFEKKVHQLEDMEEIIELMETRAWIVIGMAPGKDKSGDYVLFSLGRVV